MFSGAAPGKKFPEPPQNRTVPETPAALSHGENFPF